MPARLIHITLKNIGHLAYLDTDTPVLCHIGGANGVGKSTVIDAIKYAAGRRFGPSGMKAINHDPTMLYGNAERGEIVLRFDDPEGNIESLKCTVTPDRTGRWIKARGATAYAEAGSNLDMFFAALGYDPFAMRSMDAKDRIEHILRLIPPTITAEEIKEAVGDLIDFKPRPELGQINSLHDDFFAQRTAVNGEADTLEKQSELLAKAPGVNDAVDWSAKTEEIRATAERSKQEERVAIDVVRREFTGLQLAAEKAAVGAITEINKGFDVEFKVSLDAVAVEASAIRIKISELERQLDSLDARALSEEGAIDRRRTEALAQLDLEKSNAIETARAKANADAEAIQSRYAHIHQDLDQQLAVARTKSETQIQAEGVRNSAILTADTAKEKRGIATRLTIAIENLRKLKVEISKRMDMSGVVISAPKLKQPVDLCREEAGGLVPFSRWNTRDKNVMCLRIALKAQAACGLILIDSLGDFDEESVEELRQTCEMYSPRVQFIVGDATRGPLTVKEWAAAPSPPDTDGANV